MNIIVKISWDYPDEKFWLNPENIEKVLKAYCPNTNFEVEELEKK